MECSQVILKFCVAEPISSSSHPCLPGEERPPDINERVWGPPIMSPGAKLPVLDWRMAQL